jgi:hypothetical protein
MVMSHTPGPWVVGGELISHKSIEVASVLHFYRNKAGKPINRNSPILEVAEANAALIAAAPKLLEALTELVAEADDHPGWEGHAFSNSLGFQMARAAIAKAERIPFEGGEVMRVLCDFCGWSTEKWRRCGCCGSTYCLGCAAEPDEGGFNYPEPSCNYHPIPAAGGERCHSTR